MTSLKLDNIVNRAMSQEKVLYTVYYFVKKWIITVFYFLMYTIVVHVINNEIFSKKNYSNLIMLAIMLKKLCNSF